MVPLAFPHRLPVRSEAEAAAAKCADSPSLNNWTENNRRNNETDSRDRLGCPHPPWTQFRQIPRPEPPLARIRAIWPAGIDEIRFSSAIPDRRAWLGRSGR